jgi:hypothetical protein
MHRTGSKPLGSFSHSPQRGLAGYVTVPAGLALAFSLSLLAACGGGGDTASSRNGVSVVKPLSASAQAVAPAEPVSYEVQCSGSGQVNYQWNLGEGHTETNTTGRYALTSGYAELGKHTPSVTCTDARGSTLTLGLPVYVAVPQHTVRTIEAKSTVVAGANETKVDFNALCEATLPSNALIYQWDFGDGSRPETGGQRQPPLPQCAGAHLHGQAQLH